MLSTDEATAVTTQEESIIATKDPLAASIACTDPTSFISFLPDPSSSMSIQFNMSLNDCSSSSTTKPQQKLWMSNYGAAPLIYRLRATLPHMQIITPHSYGVLPPGTADYVNIRPTGCEPPSPVGTVASSAKTHSHSAAKFVGLLVQFRFLDADEEMMAIANQCPSSPTALSCSQIFLLMQRKGQQQIGRTGGGVSDARRRRQLQMHVRTHFLPACSEWTTTEEKIKQLISLPSATAATATDMSPIPKNAMVEVDSPEAAIEAPSSNTHMEAAIGGGGEEKNKHDENQDVDDDGMVTQHTGKKKGNDGDDDDHHRVKQHTAKEHNDNAKQPRATSNNIESGGKKNHHGDDTKQQQQQQYPHGSNLGAAALAAAALLRTKMRAKTDEKERPTTASMHRAASSSGSRAIKQSRSPEPLRDAAASTQRRSPSAAKRSASSSQHAGHNNNNSSPLADAKSPQQVRSPSPSMNAAQRWNVNSSRCPSCGYLQCSCRPAVDAVWKHAQLANLEQQTPFAMAKTRKMLAVVRNAEQVGRNEVHQIECDEWNAIEVELKRLADFSEWSSSRGTAIDRGTTPKKPPLSPQRVDVATSAAPAASPQPQQPKSSSSPVTTTTRNSSRNAHRELNHTLPRTSSTSSASGAAAVYHRVSTVQYRLQAGLIATERQARNMIAYAEFRSNLVNARMMSQLQLFGVTKCEANQRKVIATEERDGRAVLDFACAEAMAVVEARRGAAGNEQRSSGRPSGGDAICRPVAPPVAQPRELHDVDTTRLRQKAKEDVPHDEPHRGAPRSQAMSVHVVQRPSPQPKQRIETTATETAASPEGLPLHQQHQFQSSRAPAALLAVSIEILLTILWLLFVAWTFYHAAPS